MGFINSLRYAIGWRRSGEKIGLILEYGQGKISSGLDFFEINISVGYGKPGKKFITSPEIMELLQRRDLKGKYSKRSFGNIWVTYNRKTGQLNFINYYPAPEMHSRTALPEVFRGKGIAERIESRFEEEARKRFPNAKKVSYNGTGDRITQLEKRKLLKEEILKESSYERYRTTLRTKLANDLRKARTKRNLKPRLRTAKK
ncbi:MAG: hypothetical protein WC308_04575 [archaeon]|jgi:hypothetical protein